MPNQSLLSEIRRIMAEIQAAIEKIFGAGKRQAVPQINYLYNPATGPSAETPSGGPPLPSGGKVAPCVAEPGDVITIGGDNFGATPGYVTFINNRGFAWVSVGGPKPPNYQGPLNLAGTATPPSTTTDQLPDGYSSYRAGPPQKLLGDWSATLLAFEAPEPLGDATSAEVTVTANGVGSNRANIEVAYGA